MAEILVTGGAGNMGRTLAQALRAKGHSLRILDLPSCDFGFFDGWDRVRIFAGDILDGAFVREAVQGTDWVFHLAAILPPASESDRERTFRVNVEGTRSLAAAVAGAEEGRPSLIFASSVSVYGDTSGITALIPADHPPRPNDLYAESKVEAERVLAASGIPFVNLRISAVVIPTFLDPPEPWPFMAGQRIELVPLSDLVTALARLPETGQRALGRTLILAGGPAWQMTGESYVRKWAEIMDIPMEEMRFLDRPGWLNWYDTRGSQALLDYQKTPPEAFFSDLSKAVAEALEG